MPGDQCEAMMKWAKLMGEKLRKAGDERSQLENDAIFRVYRMVTKSCLLDRMVNHGEGASQTPCPVHKGEWSGCGSGWPGQKYVDGTPVKVDPYHQKQYDAGCRCFMHKCGCTTGWQPDEHCGCVEKDDGKEA